MHNATGGKPASKVFDNGRRGEPLRGCDCVQCFGYCIVDFDVVARNMHDETVEDAAAGEDA